MGSVLFSSSSLLNAQTQADTFTRAAVQYNHSLVVQQQQLGTQCHTQGHLHSGCLGRTERNSFGFPHTFLQHVWGFD